MSTPRTEREDVQAKNDGAFVAESISTVGTKETPIGRSRVRCTMKPHTERKSANHTIMTPPVEPNCAETDLPFDLSTVLPDHPSIPQDCISDTFLPSSEIFGPRPASEKESTTHTTQVGDGDEENGFVTNTTATKGPAIAISMNSDHLEGYEDGDFTTTVFADKGKRVDPREHGGAAFNPNSMIVPADINSFGVSDVMEFIGVHRDKGKNIDPKERGNEVAKYEPGPSRIDFPEYDSGSVFQKQGIPLQSLEPNKTTDLNLEPLYAPTIPRLPWHPKISPYRFIVFSIPLAIGTAKAISSQRGNVTVPITLEWMSGVVVFLV